MRSSRIRVATSTQPLVYLFLCASLFSMLCSGFVRASDNGTTLALKDDLADLKKLAMKAHSDVKFIRTLRPTYGECREIATDQENALKLWYFSVQFYEFVKSEGKLPVKETPDNATTAPVPENFSKFDQLTDSISDSYRKGNKWFVVGYEKSGEDVGRFSGFTKVKNRWIFVPRFYDAFKAKSVPTASLTVMRMFSNEMSDDLYDFCSPRLTEQFGRKDAANYFRKIGLSKVEKAEPKTTSRIGIHDRQMVSSGLNVDFIDGRAASVNMVFDVDQNNDLRLAWIGIYSRIGVDAPSLFAPLPSKSRELAKAVLVKVAKAIKSGDFKDLREASAKSIQDKMTVEQLKAAFPTDNQFIGMIPELDPASLKMAQPQSLGRVDVFGKGKFVFRPEKESAPNGPLVVKTIVESKDGKKKLGATFEFFFENQKWMPSGYSFYPLNK